MSSILLKEVSLCFEGSAFESYVMLMMAEIQKLDYRGLVFNFRGKGGVELLASYMTRE